MKDWLTNKRIWLVGVLVCLTAVLVGVLIRYIPSASLPQKDETTSVTTTADDSTSHSQTDTVTGTTVVSHTVTTLSTDTTTITDTTLSADTTTTTETTEKTTKKTTKKRTTTTKAPKKELTITSHKKTSITTTEPITTFTGSSDPTQPLLLDGKEVKRDKYGSFSVEKELKPGNNKFTFTHKGKKITYTVTYNFVVMRSHSPDSQRRLESGSTFSVVVSARLGSTVTATFNGKTITLKPTAGQGEDEGDAKSDTFVDYAGSFTLPGKNTTDLKMGKVQFRATHSGVTNTASSGTITCAKAVMPVIGEIVTFTAETFDGDKVDDDSRPTNNYLPEGTVDYVVGHSYFGDKEYLNLRCGRRVYVEKQLSPTSKIAQVTREYAGYLPDTNALTLRKTQVEERATYLTLDTQWKAPFLLDLLPQKYTNPKMQDYTVDSVTCTYVQITFCYADGFTGVPTFDKNHPLFTHATVTDSAQGKVLRLYLRRVGGFYGWDASYNDQGQLVFRFLHPAQVTEADNAYGADLSGVTIMLDVGHGATSQGAVGLDEDHPEGERNYNLALMIRDELESIGATVVLNRDDKGNLDVDQRCQLLKQYQPNLCIAIHHDANNSSKPNGFGAFHSTLFSAEAARLIYEATMAAEIYDADAKGNRNRLEWHYYFVARMSDCPVVLTENGFMTSPIDHIGIVDDDVNLRKAQAIALGTARYFLSLRIPGLPPATTTTTAPTTTTATTAATTVTTQEGAATTVTVTTESPLSTESSATETTMLTGSSATDPSVTDTTHTSADATSMVTETTATSVDTTSATTEISTTTEMTATERTETDVTDPTTTTEVAGVTTDTTDTTTQTFPSAAESTTDPTSSATDMQG